MLTLTFARREDPITRPMSRVMAVERKVVIEMKGCYLPLLRPLTFNSSLRGSDITALPRSGIVAQAYGITEIFPNIGCAT